MKKVTVEIPEGKVLEREGDIFRIVDEEPITERVKTWDDALREKVGEVHLRESEESGNWSDTMGAFLRLRVIVEALNEGWRPYGEERRWFPDITITTPNKAETMNKFTPEGVIHPIKRPERTNEVAFIAPVFDVADSWEHPACLALKSRELAVYAGTQFLGDWIDLYAEII
jgi:hypothetical protein